jgi:DinB superfamily
MAAIEVARPAADEHAAAFGRYVSRVRDVDDAVGALAIQKDRFARSVSSLTSAEATHRYAPTKWSIKELIGHVCDAERIFACRLLRIGRGDATPLPGFEENDYVVEARSDERPLSDLVDEWNAVRAATIALVRGMPDEAWARRGTSNGEPISTRALLYIILGHVDHHLEVLNTRYGVPSL